MFLHMYTAMTIGGVRWLFANITNITVDDFNVVADATPIADAM